MLLYVSCLLQSKYLHWDQNAKEFQRQMSEQKSTNSDVVVPNMEILPNKELEPKFTVVDLVGSLGPWQMNIALFYFFSYILSTFNNFGIAFHAAKTDFHCNNGNINRTQLLANYTETIDGINSCGQCQSWTFNNSIYFDQTIISEFQLTCGKQWMSSFSQSMYQIGYVISGILIGYLSDSHGRYRALCVALLFEIGGGTLLILSNSIYMYVLARFLLGFGDSGSGMCLYMLILEIVGKRHRTDVILFTSFGWVVGYLLLPGVAYLVGNFRYLQMFPTLIMAVMCVVWLPHIPESPRWLMTNQSFDKAKKILENASKRNGKADDFEKKFTELQQSVALEENKSSDNTNKKSFQNTIWSLLRNRKYRIITFILWLSFYVNGFIYHGFSLNVDIIGGNVFQNFALAGLMEIPSTVLNLIGMRYVGRKTFTISTILTASVSYIMIVILRLILEIPVDHISMICLFMLAKMFIFSTYNGIYIHAGEIFPTELRHTGVSSCSIVSRFGSTAAPFVKEITNKFGLTFTIATFGLMGFVIAILTMFLPETKDQELVDRIE